MACLACNTLRVCVCECGSIGVWHTFFLRVHCCCCVSDCDSHCCYYSCSFCVCIYMCVCVCVCAAPYLMSLLSSLCLTATPPISNACRALKANSIKSRIHCESASKQKWNKEYLRNTTRHIWKHNRNMETKWKNVEKTANRLAYFSAGLRHVCPRCFYIARSILLIFVNVCVCECACVCAVFVPAFALIYLKLVSVPLFTQLARDTWTLSLLFWEY